MIKIAQAKKVKTSDLECINALLVQLSGPGKKLSLKGYKEVVASRNTVLFLMTDGKLVIGMASLILARSTGGFEAYVDDVVVDQEYRGRGLGRKLMVAVIKHAKKAGVVKIKLTSRPKRVAANKLYQELGFERHDTNAYKMKLK